MPRPLISAMYERLLGETDYDLFAEAIEEISLKQVEAIRATGAPFMNVITYGVMPQVLNRFVGFATYQFDSNLRNSTMVGIVGAGSIGIAIDTAMNLFQWERVTVMLVAIFAVVVIAEIAVTFIRKKII